MNTPWYKQFWPWFLIAVPIITLIMGGVLLKLAISTEDSLVVDDYYKEGKAINATLDKEIMARKRNITTELTVNDGRIALKFHSGIPQEGTALKLSFYHVTPVFYSHEMHKVYIVAQQRFLLMGNGVLASRLLMSRGKFKTLCNYPTLAR